jgi:hypothetical protein
VLRQRSIVVVLGPEAVGKTEVAWKIAGQDGVRVDTHGLQEALLTRVRQGAWEDRLLMAPALILDGPVWLRGRAGVVALLAELLKTRAAASRTTVLCQRDGDGSIDELIAVMRAGSVAVIGLRFPTGKRGKLRFARRMCDQMGAPREAARGTDQLVPWRYERVIEVARRWPEPVSFDETVSVSWTLD